MDVQPSFKPDSQYSKTCKLARAFSPPSTGACSVAHYFNSSPGNPAEDAALSQMDQASLEVVAFVGVQRCRSLTGTSRLVCNRRNCVHALLKHLGVVPVRAADQDHQRDPSDIYNDVPLGAKLSSVRGVGARFLPPGGFYRGAINAGPPSIDLVMFTQASQHSLWQKAQRLRSRVVTVATALLTDRRAIRAASITALWASLHGLC